MFCAGALALAVLLAGCDAGAFEVRALMLERSWQGWEAAGVPASSLAPGCQAAFSFPGVLIAPRPRVATISRISDGRST